MRSREEERKSGQRERETGRFEREVRAERCREGQIETEAEKTETESERHLPAWPHERRMGQGEEEEEYTVLDDANNLVMDPERLRVIVSRTHDTHTHTHTHTHIHTRYHLKIRGGAQGSAVK